MQEQDFSFKDFGLKENILKGVTEAGFTVPSPIQKEAIPLIMEGFDLIGQAQTGTGKTAAFCLPTINRLKNDGSVEILVITPTRELASQVSDEFYRLGRFAGVKSVAVYGGQSIARQVDLVSRGAQVVVATPGRLLDHLESKRFKSFTPSVVILDESDEMLDMGFLDDIEEIFRYLPAERQTLLFSATMPHQIKELAMKILKTPKHVKTTVEQITNADISQRYYVVNEHERDDAVVRLIDFESPSKALVFARTKKETDELSSKLTSKGYPSRALHGDMEQRERQAAINDFKKGVYTILVATDVAARGLDITGISHVINFHIPYNPESYVHRIGRTGRAGQKGIAITLASPLEFKEMRRIQENTGTKIELYQIPSRTETIKQKSQSLIDLILGQQISDEAIALYERLKDSADDTQLGCKLLSMFIKRADIAGPDTIGLSPAELERVEQNLGQKERRGSFGAGGRGRSGGYKGSGGSRSGGYKGNSGGGGYKGNSSSGGGGDRSSYNRDRGDKDRGGEKSYSDNKKSPPKSDW